MRVLRYTNQARKFLRGLPEKDAERLLACTTSLAEDPLPPGYCPVKGREGMLRIRSGDYRVLYTVTADAVDIVRIDKRSRVYRR